MSKPKTTCKNCEKSFKEKYKFCPYCGQKDKEELTLGLLFNNTISNYFSVDARFFKSFIPLLFRPGYLAGKFIEGKRLLYLHPAQLYLFISVVFFFLFSFKVSKQEKAIVEAFKVENEIKNEIEKETKGILDVKTKDSIAAAMIIAKIKENQIAFNIDDVALIKIDSTIKKEGYNKEMNAFSFGDFSSKKIDSLIKANAPEELIYKQLGLTEDSSYFEKKGTEQFIKLYKNRGGITNILRSFYDSIPIALFVLLPIFALIMKILFFKRVRYSHHLVFSFYFFAFLFTAFSLIVATSFIWTSFPGWIEALLVLSTFIYLIIAVKQFYKQTWFVSFLKSGVATFTFFIVVLISMVFVVLFAFMSY